MTAVEAHAWVPDTLSHADVEKLYNKDNITMPDGSCGFAGTILGQVLNTTFAKFNAAGEALTDYYPLDKYGKDHTLQATRVDCDGCSGDSELAYVEFELGLNPVPTDKTPSVTEKDKWKFRLICAK